MAFVGRNEKNGAGIQESYVAMETTAKSELETYTHTHTDSYCLQRWTNIFVGQHTSR